MSPEANSHAKMYQYNFTCRNSNLHQIHMDSHLHSQRHTHRHTHGVIEIALMRTSLACWSCWLAQSLQQLRGLGGCLSSGWNVTWPWGSIKVREQRKWPFLTIPLSHGTPSLLQWSVQDISQPLLMGVRTTIALQVSFQATGLTFPDRAMGQWGNDGGIGPSSTG